MKMVKCIIHLFIVLAKKIFTEVKVTFLKSKTASEKLSEQDVSCQIIRNPNWRPQKYVYNKIQGTKYSTAPNLFLCNFSFRFS